MKNEYDNENFFNEYAKMSRSVDGLSSAGEWHQLKHLFDDLTNKEVLDLGCGYGWHCKYAVEQGATYVLGLDISHRMLQEAKLRNSDSKIEYRLCGIEEYEYPENTWDIVISNLALHYVENLGEVFKKVHRTLKSNGVFIFNIEHPVFTSGIHQDWLYDEQGNIVCWPVDDYFISGKRETNFLGCAVEKYHHTLTQIMMGLIQSGFKIEVVQEATPSKEMIDLPGMKDELRRPMMLIIKARTEHINRE